MTAVAGTPILARYFQDENGKSKWSANWIEMESTGSSYDFYWQLFSFFQYGLTPAIQGRSNLVPIGEAPARPPAPIF